MTSERSPRSRGHLARVALALLSAAAGAIHFAVTGEHFNEYWLYGVFFLTVAWLQVIWAIVVVGRSSRALLVAGGAGNLVVVAVWAMTRTIGPPVGPEAGVPESASLADALATVFEVAIAVGCVVLLRVGRPGASIGRGAFAGATALVFLTVVPLTGAALVADATDPGHGETGGTHANDEADHDEGGEAGENEDSDEDGLDDKEARSLRLPGGGEVEALLDPARPGTNRLHVAFVDDDGMEQDISTLTVHAIAETGTDAKVRVERLGPGRFVARVELDHGDWLFHMIARTEDGKKLKPEFDQHVEEPHD